MCHAYEGPVARGREERHLDLSTNIGANQDIGKIGTLKIYDFIYCISD
jgi:hypothetical protein